MAKLHVYKSEKETCQAFAEWFSLLVEDTLKKQGKFTVAFSGGDTPRLFYKILAADYATKINWPKLHIYWGDEKLSGTDATSNNYQISKSLLLDHVRVLRKNIHPIDTMADAETSASNYEKLLRKRFAEKEGTFDLAILGMGKNGNTLSLFPGNDENNERVAWVIPVKNPGDDHPRITLTCPVINAAKTKAFLITGKAKQEAVENALKGKYDPEKYPVQLIQTLDKTVHWFMDEGAAGKLIQPGINVLP